MDSWTTYVFYFPFPQPQGLRRGGGGGFGLIYRFQYDLDTIGIRGAIEKRGLALSALDELWLSWVLERATL